MNKHKTNKANYCLACGYQLDGASQIDGKNAPKKNDVSICIKCGNVALFNENLTLRHPTTEEQKELDKDDRIIEAIALIRSFRAIH